VSRAGILVIGIGNPDRGDDGFGLLVADRMTERMAESGGQSLRDTVTLLRCRGDLLSLIPDWAGYEAVICIDAAQSLGDIGRIHRFDCTQTDLPRDLAFLSSHAFGLAEAVALARTLALLPPTLVVFAVEAECFDAKPFDGGGSLTPALAEAIPRVIEDVLAEIDNLSQAHLGGTFAP